MKIIKEKMTFWGVLIIFIFLNIIQIGQFSLFSHSDEFGYIANTAFFGGYNWNPYTGNMTPYYNIGFSIFVSFIFRICKDIVTIYRLLLLYIVFLESILFIFVYLISNRHLKMNTTQSSIIALMYSMGTMAPQNALYYMSEVPFALNFIMIIYCILEAHNCKKTYKEKIYVVFSGILTAYSYSVHTRFLIILVTLIVVFFSYYIIFKETLIDYWLFIVSFIFSFVLVFIWIKEVQGILYMSTIIGRDVTGNDALTRLTYIPTYIKTFFSFDNCLFFIGNFLSLLTSMSLITGGLVWIFLINGIQAMCLFIKNKEKYVSKYVLTVTSLVSFLGMNILVAMNGVTNVYELKWLTFIRYCKPFVGLLLIVGMESIYKRTLNKKCITSSVIAIGITGITIINYMIPKMNNACTGHTDISPVGWFQYYFYKNQSTSEYFYSFFTLMFMCTCIYIYSIVYKKIKYIVITFLLISSLLCYSENKFNSNISMKNYEMCDATLDYMNKYKGKINVPIYFMQGTYSGRVRCVLFDTTMEYILEKEELKKINYEEAVLLSDNLNLFKEMKVCPKYCFELDKYEYMYTSNETIKNDMIDYYDLIKGEK